MKKVKRGILVLAVFMLSVGALSARADTLLLLGADSSAPNLTAGLLATGQFTAVDFMSTLSSTPTLAQLSGYTDVLAWTNFIPANGTALGNVLADYFDLGGKGLTVATYGFSNPWAVAGRITTGSYAGLTNLGTNGDVSGSLVATVPGDPIFSGINLGGVTYFHNLNFAHAGLAAGATLLATDGAGNNMIARSANGVVDVNLYPGDAGFDNQEFYNLLANTYAPSQPVSTPEPASLALLGTGLLGLLGLKRSRKLVS